MLSHALSYQQIWMCLPRLEEHQRRDSGIIGLPFELRPEFASTTIAQAGRGSAWEGPGLRLASSTLPAMSSTPTLLLDQNTSSNLAAG